MPILTKGRTSRRQNWGRYLATEEQRGIMSQLLLTVLEAIHLCTEPHNTHKTAPKQLSSHPSSTGMEPRASGVLDNCSTPELHPPDKNAVDKFKLPLRSRQEITATYNNLFLRDNQSKPLLCLGPHPTLLSIRSWLYNNVSSSLVGKNS